MTQQDKGGQQPGNFDGLRVIDFAHILSGPYPCKLMSDMGAEVIKVELPPTGELTRQIGYFKNGAPGYFMYRNSGKRSLCLQVRHPEGAQVFKDLVKVSDILVQNHRAGALDRWGLGYDALSQINPRLIMVSISGYGQYGPLRDWPANDMNIQAMTGAMALGGHPDGPPLPAWIPWIDFATGTQALGAIGAALYYREKTGLGQQVDLAMYDVAMNYHDYAAEEYFLSEGKVERTATGPMHPSLALNGVFECRDGYLYISCGKDTAWRALAELMDRPELGTDSRFDTRIHRNENMDEANRLVAAWIKSYDVEEARGLLQAADVLSTPILSVEEAIHHPQIEARELFAEVDHPQAGRMKTPNTPFKFSRTQARVRFRAPLLGEHNDEILSGVLEYTKEHIARLWEEKVLYAEPAKSRLADSQP